MGLEAANYISDFDSSWPLGTDGRSTADDHIRLIKTVLLATFPAAGAPITASAARMNTVFLQAVLLNASNTMSGGSIDMATGVVDNMQIQSYRETHESLGDVQTAGGAVLDYNVANNFSMNVATNTLTVTFSNWPADGIKGTINLEVTQDGTGGRSLAWLNSVKWSGGVKPPISQSAGTVSSFSFTTRDNGTTILGYQIGFDQQ